MTLGRPPTSIQRGILPFGEAYEARLPYVENFAISCSGTSGLTTIGNTFYGNNLYDPRVQLGGHQPMQFDLLALAFRRYRVTAADIELTFSNPYYDGMWCGFRVRSHTNPIATAGQTLEYVQEMQDSVVAPINNTGSQTRVFKFRFRVDEVMGLTGPMSSDLAYTGSCDGASVPLAWPLIEPFAVHTVAAEDSTIRVNIRIVYHARFYDRQTVAQS